jgi:hypothetical protein
MGQKTNQVETKETQTSQTPKNRLPDRLFVTGVIFIVLVVTSLPYVFAYISSPADKQFMGVILDVPDHWQYFSWMRELTYSNLALDKMTPEINPPVFFNLLWWILGRLGRLIGADFIFMFQILRVTAIILFLVVTFILCRRFLKDKLQQRIAFLAVTFTSGLGWVWVVMKYSLWHGNLYFPLDLYVAEGNSFLSMLGYPHFIAALLYIFVFELVFRSEEKKNLWYAVLAGVIAQFLGWQHAYDLITVYGVLGAYGLLLIVRDRRFPMPLFTSGTIVVLLSCAPAIYSVFITNANPVWQEILLQFKNADVYTPNPLHLPILMGFSFLLAIFYVIRRNPLHLKQFDNQELFLLGWFLITFVLIYLPVDYQIHLLNGWQIPISILATMALFQYIIPFIEKRIEKRKNTEKPINISKAVSFVFILILLPTNLYLFFWRFIELSRGDYPYYLYKDETAAIDWLDENAAEDDAILSSLTVGQYIPALTGSHAFLAHWADTLDFFDKRAMVDEFYSSNTTDQVRRQILDTYGVDYIFWGPSEKLLGKFDPQDSEYLNLEYDSNQVQIFKYSP